MIPAEATSRCWAEINIGALVENYKTALSFLDKKTTLIPVLKANAYGCGAPYIAKTLYQQGARLFAVASLEEALEIKKTLSDIDILVMGLVSAPLITKAIDQGIILTAFSEKSAKEISDAAIQTGKCARVHFKMDTGLHRLGFGKDDLRIMVQSALYPNLEVEGIFTHLALRSKEEDDIQFSILLSGWAALNKAGIHVKMLHACDSIGMVRYPERHYDACRVGAWLYGVCPNRYPHPEKCREVMVVRCRICQIHTIEKGQCIGYDDDHPVEKETRVATLSAGYVDGFPRFNNEGYVLIRGKKAPVLGLVCMDQMMVDVSDIHEAQEGDQATLLGDGIHVNEYAAIAHFNRNECLCRTGKRVPRIYHKDGQIIDILLDIE